MLPPKVSIIMSVYNCSKTIQECIDSIIAQSYTDWEFIICDDASTDNTYEIVKEYSENYIDKFIILRNEQNKRLAYSLNRCLEVARGEYIARMDGDDISLPNRLEEQVKFLDTHKEFSVVGTAMTPFDEVNEYSKRVLPEIPHPKIMLRSTPFAHATIMMRKSAYDAVNGYTVSKRTARAQDYDMWFRFFANGLKGYNIQESYYMVREDNSAYKRRTLKVRLYNVLTMLKGFRLLNFPIYTYIFALKPILSWLTPNFIMKSIHHKR